MRDATKAATATAKAPVLQWVIQHRGDRGRLSLNPVHVLCRVPTPKLLPCTKQVRQQRKDLTRAVTALGEEAVSKHAQVVELVTMMGQQP